MVKTRICGFALGLVLMLGAPAYSSAKVSESGDAMRGCLADKLQAAPAETTAGELRQQCTNELSTRDSADVEVVQTLAQQRMPKEIRADEQKYFLTAYKQNYVLPYSYVTHQNPIYSDHGVYVNHAEAKFQFSFRFPLSNHDLFVKGDGLDLAYTQKSFWQVYNSQSAPFRETNYDPELFYTMPLKFRPNGAETALRFCLEHESNGRGIINDVTLSRSWNRIYAKFIYAKDNYVIALRPWYRIPENTKSFPTDPGGDDNPDIEKYLGYFDLSAAVEYKNLEFSMLARNNLRTSQNYGAIELGLSFPLYEKIRGYAQWFNGYGESLIDYNHNINRVGIGFLLSDIL